MQLYAQRAALPGHALPAAGRDVPRVRGDVPVRGDARSGEGDRDRARRHAERRADGSPGLRRRRLRQDRGRAARQPARGAGRQAGGGAGADDGARRAALRHVLGALHAIFRCASPCCRASAARPSSRRRWRRWPTARSTSSSARTALLSRDVRFKDLGLLVIDEEQRFGVAHKERLKKLRTQVDVLTLTATPIPRTLQMAMGGLREISIIATPPADRLAIRTFVCRFDDAAAGRGDQARARARRPGVLRPQPDRGHRRAGRSASPRSPRRGRASRSATARCPRASSRR